MKERKPILAGIVTALGGIALFGSGFLLNTGGVLKTALSRDLLTFGAAMFLAGLITLIFQKTVRENCYMRTGLLMTAICTAAGCFAYCTVSLLTCIRTGITNHQNRFPVSIAAILALTAILIVAVATYVRLRRTAPSGKGVTLDVIRGVLFLIPGFYLCSMGDTFVVALLHHI